MTLAGVELICVVFVVIFLVGQIVDTEKTKTLKYVKLLLSVTIGWLVFDCLAMFLEGPSTPSWILWILNFLSFVMRPVFLACLSLFTNAFIVEKGNCNRWWFTSAFLVAVCGIIFTIIYFILGHVGTVQNGDFSYKEKIPRLTLYFYLIYIIYSDVVALAMHKRIGFRPGVIITISYTIFLRYRLNFGFYFNICCVGLWRSSKKEYREENFRKCFRG